MIEEYQYYIELEEEKVDEELTTGDGIELYSSNEIRKIIKSGEELYFMDDGTNEFVVKKQDIPHIIVDLNLKYGSIDLKFYEVSSSEFKPVLTTMGFYLDRVKQDLREIIIDRLISLQTGEKRPRKYKLIDSDIYLRIKNKMSIEQYIEEKQNHKKVEER